jgi:hypothetical protein
MPQRRNMLDLFGAKIEVTVEAHGLAARYVASGSYRVREGSTVEEVLRRASTKRRRPPLAVMIGGVHVETSRALVDHDVVRVFGLTAGG